MNKSQNTIEVLYIAGAGRSGSTLLELILGNSSGFFSIGEARYFWEYIEQGNVLCGCGEELIFCEFWSRVLSRLTTIQELDFQSMAKISHQLNRTRNAPWLTANLGWNRLPQYKELLTGTRHLYHAIWLESGKQIIVDSSKVPSHLSVLRNISQIQLRVLHLVRDGRAVAYSWSKRRKQEIARIANKSLMPQHSAFYSMLTWILENYFTIRMYDGLPNTLIKYEEFVENPAPILEKTLLELKFDHADLDWLYHNESLNLQPTHSIGGNPIRFVKAGVSIQADNEWQNKMPVHQKIALGLMGLPLLSQFGYKI